MRAVRLKKTLETRSDLGDRIPGRFSASESGAPTVEAHTFEYKTVTVFRVSN